MATEPIQYDRAELRSIMSAFKAMDDEAIEAAKKESSALAEYLVSKIKQAAYGRSVSATGVRRVAEGAKVSKSSKIGEFSFGFASQKFSGGATTQTLWPGLEFGSNKFKQFPRRNKLGYFIYPTLRENQNDLIRKWEEAFTNILRKWD